MFKYTAGLKLSALSNSAPELQNLWWMESQGGVRGGGGVVGGGRTGGS